MMLVRVKLEPDGSLGLNVKAERPDWLGCVRKHHCCAVKVRELI